MTSVLTARAAAFDLVPTDARSVAVVGEGVGPMTARALRDRGLKLLVDRPGWAVLSAGELALTAERLSDVPSSSLDAVVLRRAWADRREAGRLLSIAGRILRAGGAVIAVEIDADTLLEGSVARYPVATLWRNPGAPVAGFRSTAMSPAVLSTDAVAARFRDVNVTRFDEVHGEHPSMAALWRSLREHGWRGDAWLAPARRAELFERLAAAQPPRGTAPVVDREPWFAVTGVRP